MQAFPYMYGSTERGLAICYSEPELVQDGTTQIQQWEPTFFIDGVFENRYFGNYLLKFQPLLRHFFMVMKTHQNSL